MEEVAKLYIGAINPFALTEVLTGRKIDWTKRKSFDLLEDTLETDYSELFDMRYNSPLYAGLKINDRNMAEPVDKAEITVRGDNDTETPDLSGLKNLDDLKRLGVNDVETKKIRSVILSRGILNVKLELPEMDKTLSKTRLSKMLADIVMPSVSPDDTVPDNTSWKVFVDFSRGTIEYSEPVQGALGNSYFIAALMAVAWANPFLVLRKNHSTGGTSKLNSIQFYSKGGEKDAPSKRVEVSDKILINTLNNLPVYCRSSNGDEMYPALYEKAYAKWISKTGSDRPDITKTAFGDPVKATAQLNNKNPQYYLTASRTGDELYSIVRSNSMSYKTIHPMTAWTYASHEDYTGINIAGNHAYTVLGWAFKNTKKYIVLRNPWGITEPEGFNTNQGVFSSFDKSFWMPVNTIGKEGVFAVEINAFQDLFAGIGVAK
jgi:hypothetical protein